MGNAETEAAAKEQETRGILAQILTNEARDRLARLGLVKPEKAARIESMLVDMAKRGQIRARVTEPSLVQFLESLASTETGVGHAAVVVSRKTDDEDFEVEDMINQSL